MSATRAQINLNKRAPIRVVIMETVQIKREALKKILSTAELLVDEVEQALSQDEIAKNRMNDIRTGKLKGAPEKELDIYLAKRGIKIE